MLGNAFRGAAAAFLIAVTPAHALDFEQATTPSGTTYILASGSIEPDDHDRIERILHGGLADERIIAFDSPGGSLWGGVMLGQVLRLYGFSTYVMPGHRCLSACFFAFVGGETRFVYPEGALGVHQFYGGAEDTKSQKFTQYSTGALLAFVREMGVAAEVIEIASQTFPDEIHVFSAEELTRHNLSIRHRLVPFAAKEAQRLGISEEEYRRRWRSYLSSEAMKNCFTLTTTARDVCLFAARTIEGLKR
ncbi:hypothetical protein [Shinella pollutisoli]|uniref:Uncharacterized protein n=1 Tax=Shinella pollutisoli TaxID=2250594 RepID=A0ABV7DJ19_9HYPH|nr:hypothetical protein [Shinella pollutisoli]